MILAQYLILSNYSIGILLLTLISIGTFIKYKDISINKWILYFILICVLSQLLIHQSLYGVATFLISVVSLAIFSNKIDEHLLLKYFKIFGTVAIIAIIYQSVYTYIFKVPVSPIKILPLDSEQSQLNWAENLLRPSSFFSEPQAYATYMMPFLFLTLKHQQFKWAVLITISVLLSTSSQGFIMMSILWLSILLNWKLGALLKISIFVLIIGFIFSYLTLPVFEVSRNKILQTEIIGNPRLSRGFEIFSSLNNHDKIFGIGFGNVGDYVYNIQESFTWAVGNTKEKLNYTSGFSGILTQFGLIVTIFFVYVMFRLWKVSQKINRPFLIMIFAAFFLQNLLLNSWFIYLFLFYLGINNLSKKERLQLRFSL